VNRDIIWLMGLRRAFLWSMIISLSLAAALGIWALLLPGFGRTQQRVLITAVIFGGYSILALACASALEKRPRSAMLTIAMWVGIVASAFALALWLGLVWEVIQDWVGRQWGQTAFRVEEEIAKTAGTATIIAACAAHAGLLRLLPLRRGTFIAVRAATIVCAVILGAMITVGIWFEAFDNVLERLIGVAAILTACGTVVTPILARIEHLRPPPETIPSRLAVQVRCPRCGGTQRIVANRDGRCGGCGLRLRIEVEEPRCECGYLLYNLTGENCPECGRAIPHAERWKSNCAITDDVAFAKPDFS
jgi:hypothetical protein